MFQFQRKTAEGKELFAAEPQILEILDVHDILLAEQLLMPRQSDIRNRVEADHIKTDALIRAPYYKVERLFIEAGVVAEIALAPPALVPAEVKKAESPPSRPSPRSG